MAAPMPRSFCQKLAKFWIILLISTPIIGIKAWDSDDFELFDNVEEINQNFYELLGVKEDATTSEIRRAYRKLSLQLHPDKNPDEDAAVKFRHLVSVYETLKDEVKREKYNQILVTGLPDWRQPIFYYRRVRKMGLAELAVLLFVIATIGQYLYKWAVYFERRLTIDDMISQFRKKSERRKKRLKPDDDPDVIEEALISQLPKPSIRTLLPFQLWHCACYLVTDGPSLVLSLKQQLVEYRQRQQELAEQSESEEEVVERVRVRPKRRLVVSDDNDDLYKQTATPVTYTPVMSDSSQKQNGGHVEKVGEWDNEDFILLAKAVAKFPGGTVERWEKIARYVGRPQSEVVAKSKSLKSHITASVDPSLQGTTGAAATVRKAKTTLTDDMVTTRENQQDDQQDTINSDKSSGKNSKLKQTSGRESHITGRNETEASVNHSGDSGVVWTQEEQKCLEWALAQYPKGTPERWEKIAAEISGKTKEQCMERFKYLAQMLKKKREQQSQR